MRTFHDVITEHGCGVRGHTRRRVCVPSSMRCTSLVLQTICSLQSFHDVCPVREHRQTCRLGHTCMESRVQWRGSANTSGPFPTRPSCQIGDTVSLWSLVIASQSQFGNCATDLAVGASQAKGNEWLLKGRIHICFPSCASLGTRRLLADCRAVGLHPLCQLQATPLIYRGTRHVTQPA